MFANIAHSSRYKKENGINAPWEFNELIVYNQVVQFIRLCNKNIQLKFSIWLQMKKAQVGQMLSKLVGTRKL